MDSVNRNAVTESEGHPLEPPPNWQPLVMIPTPNRISIAEEASQCQSMVTSATSSLYHHNPPPAVTVSVSNSLALTNGTHQNSTVLSSRPHTDQNLSLTRFNPYANQGLGLTSTSYIYGPHFDPKVNSISSRPHANWHDTFPNGKHQPMPLASVSRPHDYLANISNHTNDTRFPVSTISPPITGVGSSSTSAFHGASTYPPTRSFYVPAYTHPQQLPEPWSFQQQRIPSIHEDQLRKYLCHWNRRPKDNNISFWREFVNEYYAPNGKRKCCLSAWTDYITTKYRKWKDKSPCDHCRTHSQYGYDISFEELPIYFQYKFNTLKSEKLKLGAFREVGLENKNTVLYFANVSEEAMDDHFLTVQEGPLAVIFTVDNKISSWQFCVRNCEKLAARSDLHSRVNEVLRNAGDSSGASGSKSDQQWTKENCSTTNSMGINFRNQNQYLYGTDSLQNCNAQQSSGHQIQTQTQTQTQSLSTIISQSLGANKKQVNLRVPQLLHPPSILDTSASSCRFGTGTESSSINSNGTTNPLCMASTTVNAASLPGPSEPTVVNLLKRIGDTDALLGNAQCVTRQRFGDTLISGNEVTTGSSLVVDGNMLELEGADLDNYLTDIAILEDLLKQYNSDPCTLHD